MDPADVDWILYCEDAGNFYYRSGSLDSWVSGRDQFGKLVLHQVPSQAGIWEEILFRIDSGTNTGIGAKMRPNWLDARGGLLLL